MRKIEILITCVAMLSLVLAACAPAATTTPTAAVPVTGSTATVMPTTAATSAPTTAPTTAATAAATSAPTTAATSAPTTAPTSTYTMRTPQQAALDAAGGKKIGGSVTFLGPWGGSEQTAFMAMLKPFEDATGVTVNYTGSRDESALLVTQVQGGNPPDLADFANPGQIAQFSSQGKLVDLSKFMDMNTLKSQYAQTWLDLGTFNGQFNAMIIKAATKGLIWYDPKVFQANNYQVPTTWDQMISLSNQIISNGGTPWCLAVESGAASGWPGTDWLEDIILRQDGAKFYNDWWAGKVSWTSPEIKKAFQTWGTIVANSKMLYGGTNTVLSTNFQDVGTPLFTNPPGCYMVHQASFIAGFFTTNNPKLVPGTDFKFFPFPNFTANAPVSTEMAGDLVAAFKDTPQSEALIKYLSTPEAQSIWAKIGGGYLSANKDVPLSTYPDVISHDSANVLVNASVAVFDASDQMPQQMNSAFYTAILNYIQNPSNLDSILQNLDTVRASSYK